MGEHDLDLGAEDMISHFNQSFLELKEGLTNTCLGQLYTSFYRKHLLNWPNKIFSRILGLKLFVIASCFPGLRKEINAILSYDSMSSNVM